MFYLFYHRHLYYLHLDHLRFDRFRKTDCEICVKGKYQSERGTTACLNCIPGFFNSQFGQINCTICAVGRQSSITAREEQCNDCIQGRYQSEEGTTAENSGVTGLYGDLPSSLIELYLENNAITTLPSLELLSSLKRFEISYNKLTAFPKMPTAEKTEVKFVVVVVVFVF